jgi:mycofactocin precursor
MVTISIVGPRGRRRPMTRQQKDLDEDLLVEEVSIDGMCGVY